MTELPTGTVTFLFTDVEGSTRLLEQLGPGYSDALAEHRRVVREAVGRHGGIEVDTQGDAFFCAFPAAAGALAAAEEAQQALALPVRMGIHTGEAELTEEGYVGLELHRAARICAAAHGGQVVASEVTRALLASSNTVLLDLGEHRLKDFEQPIALYQLGERAFPPLRTVANTNLPRPASSFVGRERELEQVAALLQDGARLVTLTGPGGSGKTRLAIEAAAELVPEFKAGVFWVGLATLRDPALVTETIVQTLGAKEGLREHIGERELLVLLDNLEQVVEAAPQLASLVESCPNLRLLVTSRELLHVRGEVEYAVPPLPEPDAVALFCERARVEPAEEIAELCRRLDSLPLAVELAAARTSVLSPKQILERLSSRLDLLKGGRDAEARQQTLRATIEWSHSLLDTEEQQLFGRLAVFRGGCSLEAAEEVAGADLDVLQSLVDKSLLRHTGECLWMLETIREYAAERLEACGQAEHYRGRLARLELELAEEAEPHLVGPDQEEWLGRIGAELDNIRAALEWELECGNNEQALRIATGIGRFWWVRGAAEGLAWLERGLEATGVPPAVRAAALDVAGGTAWFVGDRERALALFEEGHAIFRQLGDEAGRARMLSRLAPPLLDAGRAEEAERLLEEAVRINRELGLSDELSLALNLLGSAAWERGDLETAAKLLEESVALAREIGHVQQLAWALHNLADLELLRGDLSRAWAVGCEALATARRIGDDLAVLICLGILAATSARRGDASRAGALWGAAERLDSELGETLWRHDRAETEALLGERGPAFERAVEEGRTLSLEDAVAVALAD